MEIAKIQQFYNNKITFKSNKNSDNVIYSPKKEDKDTVILQKKKEPPKFLEEIKDFIECLFLKDTITYGSSRRKKTKVLTESDIPYYDAKAISKFKKKEFEQAMELLQLGLDEDVVRRCQNLTEEQFEQAKKLLEKEITNENLLHLAKLPPNKFNEILQLYDDGLDDKSLIFYSQSGEYQKAETKKLLAQGEIPQKAVIFPKFSFDEERKTFFNDLFNKGISQETAFELALKDNLHERFNELIEEGTEEAYILDIAQLSDKEKRKYNELKRLGIEYYNLPELSELDQKSYDKVKHLMKKGVLADYARAIFEIENGIVKNKKYEKYRNKGYGRNSAFALSLMKKDEEKIIQNFLKEQPQIEEYFKKNYDISVLGLQQQDTNEITFTKEYYKNGTTIITIDTLNSNKELRQYRSEKYQDGSISTSIKSGNKSIIIKREKNKTISEIIEFLKDKTGAVTGVLHSKKSNDLVGVMNTTYYDINDFICDNNPDNINQDIENSVKTKGTEISKTTKNPDGSIEYNEKQTTRGYTTQRHFKKNSTNTEKEYTYKITDINGNELVSINNYWKQNPNNTVTNIINGNEYLLSFNENKKEITISYKDKTKTINLNNKLAKYPKETLWQIAKTLDVDSLLEIDEAIKKWKYCSDIDSTYERKTGTISIGENTNIISHEVGHIKKYKLEDNENFEKIKNSYLKEMKLFETNNTLVEQDLIEYFSPRAEVSESIGIDELIAEANMIFNSYGNISNERSLKIRSQILVRNFPETLAKIAEYTGKNSKEPLI